jgi:metal-responsive CopG/Arc/MetJ family transcriptional regulator
MYRRSSAGITKGIHVRLRKELLCEIDGFRRSEADIPTRPEAVRRLLEQAVTARQEEVASNLHQQGA